MAKYILILFIPILFMSNTDFALAQEIKEQDKSKSALIIIDIQDFYFPGGMLPLFEPEKAVLNAQKVLQVCREEQVLIIHVKHNASSGAEIHELVKPINGEKVILKDKANAFIDTDLLNFLNKNNVKDLFLCGMQPHMCVEAATRAASDYSFNCTVIEDACTTRDLKYGYITVKAKDVHFSTLSTLNGTYAKVVNTETYLNEFKKVN
jgi:nicotinamidase-related amidase